MSTLTKMLPHFTNTVLELVPVAVMALVHLLPTSADVLFSTIYYLTLNQVNNPGTAAVQIVPDVIGSAAIPAGEGGGDFYDRTGNASPSVTFVTSLVSRW